MGTGSVRDVYHVGTMLSRMSEEHRFLQQLEKDVVLVSVVGQRYVGEEGGKLWELLLES